MEEAEVHDRVGEADVKLRALRRCNRSNGSNGSNGSKSIMFHVSRVADSMHGCVTGHGLVGLIVKSS